MEDVYNNSTGVKMNINKHTYTYTHKIKLKIVYKSKYIGDGVRSGVYQGRKNNDSR